jgi:outer membrane protein assembly factor BamB
MVSREDGVAGRAAICLAAVFYFWLAQAPLIGADRFLKAGDDLGNEDVLAEVTRQNSDDYPQPPALERKGSVSRVKSPQVRVERGNGDLLRVHLANGQPLLSPAAGDGKVFVGSGFSGREFHCLDAATGRAEWTVNLSDNGPSYPSYHRGTVVFTTESCTCYALDAETGASLWSVWLGDPVISSPTIAGGSVLVSYPAQVPFAARSPAARTSRSSRGKTAARAAAAGQQAARRPTLPQPTAYVFAARNLRTGTPQWQKWIDHHVMSAPVIHGEEAYVVTFAGTLYKFRLSDGEILMARRCRATSAPVVMDDGIYLTRRADPDGSQAPQECLVKLDLRTGRQRYSVNRCPAPYLAAPMMRRQLAQAVSTAAGARVTPAGERPYREPLPGEPNYVPGGPKEIGSPSMRLVGRDTPMELQAFAGSRLVAFEGGIFNCMGGRLWAIDMAGQRQWDLDLRSTDRAADDGEATAPPALAGGYLFVATRGGLLLRIDPIGGEVTGRMRLGSPAASQPVIADGRIFVGTVLGDLVCIKTGNRKLTGWNQWGGNAAHSGVAESQPDEQQTAKAER